ncbi:citrate synthase [Candidatus Bathyarchaeota archaeon]|nr:MAG: citrate synthase [Candidatus Bathyarchaeota archaeon]TMI29758.1 MAG: citrate synthase [Candidatus Bathyarchaeota archaeon]
MAEIEKGLEGVVIGKSAITFIDGLHGILRYRGIDIKELAKNSSYEEVSYLLWNGRLPTKTQLSKFAKDLSRQRSLSPAVVQVLKSLPRNSDPMEVARTAVSYVAAFPRKKSETFERANHRKAVQLASSLSTIVSTYDRVRRGQRPLRPDSKLGHAANFLYLRTGRKPSREFERAYDTICMLYADHEMNASTFAGCVTVSTLADLGGGVTSAIATLAGPLHGGSNQRVMEMLEKIGSADKIEKFVDDELAAGRRIMGFGHRIYKNFDPRALILKEVADRLTRESKSRKWFDMAEKIEDYVWEKKNLRPNIEFYAAVTLNALGIPKDLMPSVFACNRIVGWIAHIFEQYADNRLMRPLTEYVGPEEQHYVPLSQRS